MSTTLNVSIRGPLFEKNLTATVQAAIISETLDRISQELDKKAANKKRLGRKNNRVTNRREALVLTSTSTLRDPSIRRQRIPSFGRGAGRRKNPDFNPRVKGTTWVKKNIGQPPYGKGVIGSMLPRVLRKTAERIVGELN